MQNALTELQSFSPNVFNKKTHKIDKGPVFCDLPVAEQHRLRDNRRDYTRYRVNVG